MPKGDPKRIQNAINYQGGRAQNQLDNTFNNILPQNQQLQNRYNVSADQSQNNYNQMYQGYNDLFNNLGSQYGSLMNQTQGAFGQPRDVYSQFAQTGGYSPQDIQDIRARAIAPTRAVYQNAQNNIDRQRALSGGYSPNYTAASAKLARDLSQSISDANVNANASIADSIRQGKLAGAGGLTNVDATQLGLLNSILGGQSNALNETMSGQRSLYGTIPGQTSMYGTQLGQSNQQMSDLAQLQNQLAQIIIEGQLGRGQMPTRWDQFKTFASGVRDLGSTAGSFAASHSSLKDNIIPVNESNILDKLNELSIFTWNYKYDDIKHIGPMAEDLQRIFGVGDGKTIALVDIMGIMLMTAKALAFRNENHHA